MNGKSSVSWRKWQPSKLPIIAEMNVAQQRERQRILDELVRVKGLMPVLMKPRNGQHWTDAERAMIMAELHELAALSPYLVPVVMPGGVFLLPLLAWWLDRRRLLRDTAAPRLTAQPQQGYNDDAAAAHRAATVDSEGIQPSLQLEDTK